MKHVLAFIIVIIFMGGCAYNPPVQNTMEQSPIDKKREVNLAYDQAFKNTINALYDLGYSVKVSDKDNGIITTEKKHVSLNEDQADCGNIWGIPYLKDKRTTSHAAHSVRVRANGDKSTIQVNTEISAIFNATASGETKSLSCVSSGYLERILLDKI